MKIISDQTLEKFQTWSDATDTKNRIIEAGKEEQFESMIEELFPDGLTDTQLNDYLWFESEQIFSDLGIEEEETEE